MSFALDVELEFCKWLIGERISDPAYTRNFLGLAKKIAPDGERIRQVGFTVLRSDGERSIEITRPTSEIPSDFPDFTVHKIDSERSLEIAQRASEISLDFLQGPLSVETETVELHGTLGYADAIHHSRIEIIDKKGETHEVQVPEGMMNDVVRPMWGLVVMIKGVRKGNLIELQEISESRED